MRLTVLGSGQDGGLPQAAAAHVNDDDARGGVLPERTGPSLLVETGGMRLVCDVSPDFRVQWWNRPFLPDAVALTHAHMGHYAGLVHLGKEAAAAAAIPLFCSERMAGFLSGNSPWRDLLEEARLIVTEELVWAARRIDLIPVPHRGEHTDTVAISIDRRVLWLPDIDDWEGWPQAQTVIGAHEVAFLDGTFWSADEVPGRSIADIPHPLVPDTIRRFERLETRVVLVHLNHTNPICDPASEEAGSVIAAGVEIGFDGMTIDL